jgi:hypothetical protein
MDDPESADDDDLSGIPPTILNVDGVKALAPLSSLNEQRGRLVGLIKRQASPELEQAKRGPKSISPHDGGENPSPSVLSPEGDSLAIPPFLRRPAPSGDANPEAAPSSEPPKDDVGISGFVRRVAP